MGLIVTFCQPPGSGKSTIIRRLSSTIPNSVIVSRDQIQHELNTTPAGIFLEGLARIDRYYAEGKVIFLDITNSNDNYLRNLVDKKVLIITTLDVSFSGEFSAESLSWCCDNIIGKSRNDSTFNPQTFDECVKVVMSMAKRCKRIITTHPVHCLRRRFIRRRRFSSHNYRTLARDYVPIDVRLVESLIREHL